MTPYNKEYTSSISEARVYTLKGRAQGYGRWWAEVTIREWPGGGSVNIQSESGSYATFWTAIGDVCLRKFLCSLHFDYFMERCCGSAYIEGRREGWLKPEAARDIWNELTQARGLPYSSLSDLLHEIDASRVISELYDGDYCSAPDCEKPRQECLNFWRHIWPCACEVWREELEAV